MNVLLPAGHTFLFNWTMEAEANSGSDDYSALPSSSADLSHTGRLTIDALTPGGGPLAFLSGTDYRSSPNVSAAPEPSTTIRKARHWRPAKREPMVRNQSGYGGAPYSRSAHAACQKAMADGR
jgi:hypothetical protein